jgi:hypothetical protein
MDGWMIVHTYIHTVKYSHHPAETITFLTEDNEETSTIQIFTDGSKSEGGQAQV